MTCKLCFLVVLASVTSLANDKPLELNTVLMQATVRLDGMTADGPKVGTGFIMGRPIPNSARARYVLITANHVLDDIKSHVVMLTTRKLGATAGWEKVQVTVPIRSMLSTFFVRDAVKTPVLKGSNLAMIFGATRYDLKPISDSLVSIRDSIRSLNLGLEADIVQDNRGFQLQLFLPNPNTGVPIQLIRLGKTGPPETLLSEKQLWNRHPQADVAAMYIRLPNGTFDGILLPTTTFLAQDKDLQEYGMHPGDELNCLGYPLGAESNDSGFPILRSGKIASFPLLPTKQTVVFLMDFQIFGGNSGGPVYVSQSGGTRLIDGNTRLGVNFQTIVGLVSQEVLLKEQQRSLYERSERDYPLKLARVVHASFIRETLETLPPPTEGNL
jgi:hypothetical protein